MSIFLIHGETAPSGPVPPYCRGVTVTLCYTYHTR